LASVSSPVTVSFPFGPGLDLDGFGTIVLYDTRRRRSDEFERRLNVDSYYVAPNGESVRTGEACPIPFSEFLPSDDKFPLTLYALEGTEDQTVYACSGSTIVGVADFSYVANSVDTPSLSPTVPSPVRYLCELCWILSLTYRRCSNNLWFLFDRPRLLWHLMQWEVQ